MGKTLRTYVHGAAAKSILPSVRYVRTLQNIGKPVYIGSGNRLNTEEAPDSPTGGIRNFVAVFQIVLALVSDHAVAEAAAFQRRQAVFLAPHPINLVQILGADGAVRFQPDIALGFQKIKDIVVVPFDRLTVIPRALAFRELEVVGDKPL